LYRIGTSGWTYRHWKGEFYPDGVPQRRWLEHYSEHFDTVELNASFYRIPKASTAEGWLKRTPEEFRFAVKASRLITHVRRLSECRETLEWFFRELWPLREKICAYLFQLPPSFAPPPELLESFLSLLPPDNRYVFELRNPECYAGVIPEVLERHGIAFCIHDLADRETPQLVTSSLVYVRFHGTTGRYSGSYPEHQLQLWASRIRLWSEQGKDVLAYFNNDIQGHAIRNARALLKMLGR
jgi:uncharacterized protein YecE (DUF72 family)